MKFPSTCNPSSLNNPKYEVNISPENFIASAGDIIHDVETSISKFSKLVISSILVDSTEYLTFVIGEKLASINNTLTSSSFSLNSSIDKYPTFLSILISISNSSQSLSISVIYISLFKILTPAGACISAAVTTPALFLFNFNHSIQVSFFSIISPFKLSITSTIPSFIQGSVEYSWLTHFTLIPVILVQGSEDNKTLLIEFHKVIP